VRWVATHKADRESIGVGGRQTGAVGW